MINTNAILLCDTYKTCHMRQYDHSLTKLVSYWVPRKSMLESCDKMVFFGLQAFIQEYMLEYFSKNFFDVPAEDIKETFTKYMNIQLGEGNYDVEPVMELHALGYLPLQIKALPEGSKVNMGVPCIELTNTDSRFAWVVQWIECALQSELWKPCNHATIGNMYLELATYWYNKNADKNLDPRNAFADFGMRGMSCINEAVRCSSAWLLSSNKTSTIAALPWLDKYYDADCSFNHIGLGGISTEHSVMASNYALDIQSVVNEKYGSTDEFVKNNILKKIENPITEEDKILHDELSFEAERRGVKRLLDTYKNSSFSMVSDTYDYWRIINKILPSLKDEIMSHNGKLLVRPDSGDMVQISIETVQKLWNTFGGTINSRGYKVLDPHIGLIYGDGCTLNNLKKIWTELDRLGFAANNVIFGIGAFCFTAIFDKERLVVNTRDTFGIAMKATYGMFGKNEVKIFKDPKTDSGLKKSHKGLVHISGESGKYSYTDNLLNKEYAELELKETSPMRLVYCDGKMYNKETFNVIRERLSNTNKN